jgi:hypothetical protein
MSPRKPKQDVITFKVDSTVAEAMRGIPNRSEFIRSAILSAFENTCPLCKGQGILSPDQRRHWETFAHRHSVEECDDCHAFHLVCSADRKIRDAVPEKRIANGTETARRVRKR